MRDYGGAKVSYANLLAGFASPKVRFGEPKAGPPRLERGTARLECDVLPLKLWTRAQYPTRKRETKKPAIASFLLFLRLFVRGSLSAGFAILLKINLTFNRLTIFRSVIIDIFAFCTCKFDQVIL